MNACSLDCIRELACGLGACAVALASAWAARSAGIRSALAAHCGALELELRCLRSPLRAPQIVRAQSTGCVLALGLALALASWIPLLAAVALVLAPMRMLERSRRQRAAAIDAQLDVWLLALANQLRASPALGDALRASARLVPEPLRGELTLVHNQVSLGVAIDRALADMAARVQSPLCSAALAGLRIARTTGGDLSATLEASAASLRELARLEGVVRTKTAEGRAQALLIGVTPAPLLVVLQLIDPELMAPLFAKPLGNVLLALAAACWLCAVIWARRIVAVDI